MQNNTYNNCIELLNEMKRLCEQISFSDLDIPEDDKEFLYAGLSQTKMFIGNCLSTIDNKINKS